jgi:hypothetical protein
MGGEFRSQVFVHQSHPITVYEQKGGGGVDVLCARLLGERSRKGNFNGLVVRGSFVHVQRRGDIITLVLD